jgi:hypothetical protein
MCPACLDSLLNLCRTLPRHLLQTRVMGIVRLDDPHTLSPRRIKIAQKKIKGFVHANRIIFPVLLDKNSSPQPSGDAKTQIWVLSDASKELVRFEFPLSAADINSLCRIVFSRLPDK